MSASESVTVIVPTVDRVDLLRRCLRGLAGHDVLVVHDGDAGVLALLATEGVRGLQIVERGVSAKRNAGWQAAATDRVAFTDDDCEPTAGWLEHLLLSDADVVAGPVVPHPQDRRTGPWDRTVTSTAPAFYPGCNLLVRKEFLARVEGFDEALRGGEDTDLVYRVRDAGGKLDWNAQAVVWHAVRPQTYIEHLRSLPRWAGLPAVVRRHPELRRFAHRRLFWKDTHPRAVVALAGLLASPWQRSALLLTLPVLAHRMRQHGVVLGLQHVGSDLMETVVLTSGSARHRSVLL